VRSDRTRVPLAPHISWLALLYSKFASQERTARSGLRGNSGFNLSTLVDRKAVAWLLFVRR